MPVVFSREPLDLMVFRQSISWKSRRGWDSIPVGERRGNGELVLPLLQGIEEPDEEGENPPEGLTIV